MSLDWQDDLHSQEIKSYFGWIIADSLSHLQDMLAHKAGACCNFWLEPEKRTSMGGLLGCVFKQVYLVQMIKAVLWLKTSNKMFKATTYLAGEYFYCPAPFPRMNVFHIQTWGSTSNKQGIDRVLHQFFVLDFLCFPTRYWLCDLLINTAITTLKKSCGLFVCTFMRW